jgi:hypothetical protein
VDKAFINQPLIEMLLAKSRFERKAELANPAFTQPNGVPDDRSTQARFF